MEYRDYKQILDEAMVSYVNHGGSTYNMNCVLKEYIFPTTMSLWQTITRNTYQIKQCKLS